MKKSVVIKKDISTLSIINGGVDNINVGDVLHYKETFPFIKVRVNNTKIAGDMFVSIRTLIDNEYVEIINNDSINKKGKFIVFESIDDTLLSKQIEMYHKYLLDNNIKHVIHDNHFITNNTDYDNVYIAEVINNLYDLNDTIIDNINNGYVVLCNSWLYRLLSIVDNKPDLFNSILCLTNSLILPNKIIYLERTNVNTDDIRYLNYQYIINEDYVSYDLIKVIKVGNDFSIIADNIKMVLTELLDK